MVVTKNTPRYKQHTKNKQAEVKINTKNKINTKINKSKSNSVKDDNKNKTNPDEDDDKGNLDEKGNPLPIDNPEGGDPICSGGYKIDYQFDPMNDPINPLFRCIPALTDPTDGIAGKLLKMANNPSSGVGNLATGNLPVVSGIRGGRGRGRGRGRETKRRSRARSHRRHRTRRHRTRTS